MSAAHMTGLDAAIKNAIDAEVRRVAETGRTAAIADFDNYITKHVSAYVDKLVLQVLKRYSVADDGTHIVIRVEKPV